MRIMLGNIYIYIDYRLHASNKYYQLLGTRERTTTTHGIQTVSTKVKYFLRTVEVHSKPVIRQTRQTPSKFFVGWAGFNNTTATTSKHMLPAVSCCWIQVIFQFSWKKKSEAWNSGINVSTQRIWTLLQWPPKLIIHGFWKVKLGKPVVTMNLPEKSLVGLTILSMQS